VMYPSIQEGMWAAHNRAQGPSTHRSFLSKALRLVCLCCFDLRLHVRHVVLRRRSMPWLLYMGGCADVSLCIAWPHPFLVTCQLLINDESSHTSRLYAPRAISSMSLHR
jgi:hypothetical protein